jgi:hypothetical protein
MAGLMVAVRVAATAGCLVESKAVLTADPTAVAMDDWTAVGMAGMLVVMTVEQLVEAMAALSADWTAAKWDDQKAASTVAQMVAETAVVKGVQTVDPSVALTAVTPAGTMAGTRADLTVVA